MHPGRNSSGWKEWIQVFRTEIASAALYSIKWIDAILCGVGVIGPPSWRGSLWRHSFFSKVARRGKRSESLRNLFGFDHKTAFSVVALFFFRQRRSPNQSRLSGFTDGAWIFI